MEKKNDLATVSGSLLFNRNYLGWACVFLAGVLLIIFAIAVWNILPLITQPPGFIDRFLEKADNLEVSYVTTLEYESFVIRTQGAQIALGLLVGMVMGVFGLLIFAIGVRDAFSGEGSSEGSKWKIQTTAPGLVVLLASSVIIGLAVNKDVRRSFEASFEEGKKPRIISGGEYRPTMSGKGEEKPEKEK